MRNMTNKTLLLPLSFASMGAAQDRDHDRVTRIERGTVIAVRNNQAIDSDHRDNRVYYGTVDRDVRGGNGRLAIPRGSQVEMIVRVARDNDLVLDLESVTVKGQRYAIETSGNRVESKSDESPRQTALSYLAMFWLLRESALHYFNRGELRKFIGLIRIISEIWPRVPIGCFRQP